MCPADRPAPAPAATPAPAGISWQTRRAWALLLAVGTVAVAARAAYLAAFLRSPLGGFFFADQMYYRNWALRIASGDWLPHGVFEQGPLYPYLLSLPYALLGPGDLPVLGLQAICGVMTVGLVFACANRLFGLGAAAAAGGFAAVCGPAIFYESQVMKTFLEPLLVTAALYAALRFGERARAGWLAASCAALGLACLVREIHALLLPVVLVWAWLSGGGPGLPRRRRATHLAAGALAFALPILPAALANRSIAGENVLVTAGAGEVWYMAFGPDAKAYYHPPDFVRPIPRLEHLDFRDEASLRAGTLLSAAQSSRFWFREAVRAAAASPRRVLGLLASRAALVFNDFEVPDSESIRVARDLLPPLRALPTFGWFVGPGLLGAWLALRDSARARLALAFALVLVGQVLATYVYGRFRAAFAAVWLICAGRAAVWLYDVAIHPAAWRRWQTWSGLAIVVVASTAAFATPPGVPAAWLAADLQGYRQELAAAAQHRRALPALRQALAARPDDPWVLDSLGTELENAGRGYEAVPYYEAAIRLDPTLVSSHWRLADIFYREGLLPAAVRHARVVAGLDAASAEAHVAVAVFCSRLALARRSPEESGALLAEAEEHFALAVRLEPGDALAYRYRGRFRALRGLRDEAAADLARASALTAGGPPHVSLPW